MKAVVLEIRKKEAAVLVQDGQIIKIRRLDLQPGDTIEISEADLQKNRTRHFNGKMTRYATAAALALALLGGGGTHMYNTAFACSYVSLDINPSIEYVLNRQDQILDVLAVNDDAKEIVAELKESGIKKDSLSEALEKTTEILESSGYITDDTDYIIVNVASDDKKRSKALKKEANKVFDDINKKNEDNVHLTLTDSSIDQRKKAKELGISTGKYEEIREINNNESDDRKSGSDKGAAVTLDDVKKYSDYKIKDLLKEAGELPDTTQKNTQGNDSGTENKSASSAEKKTDNSDVKQNQSSGNQTTGKTQPQITQSENADKNKQSNESSTADRKQNDSQEKDNTQNNGKDNAKSDTKENTNKNTQDNKKNDSDNNTKENVKDDSGDNTKNNTKDNTAQTNKDNAGANENANGNTKEPTGQQGTNSNTQNNVNDNSHNEPNGETNHTFSTENNQTDFQPRTENMQDSGGRE